MFVCVWLPAFELDVNDDFQAKERERTQPVCVKESFLRESKESEYQCRTINSLVTHNIAINSMHERAYACV